MTAFFFFLTWHTHNSIEHRDTIGLKNRRRGERNCSFRATRKKNAIGITKRPSTPPAQRPRFHSRLRMGGHGKETKQERKKKEKKPKRTTFAATTKHRYVLPDIWMAPRNESGERAVGGAADRRLRRGSFHLFRSPQRKSNEESREKKKDYARRNELGGPQRPHLHRHSGPPATR